MAINFPNSPVVNDTFTVGGINFTFTGVKWESGAVVELSSDTTPTLGGNLDGGAKNINNVGVITATGFSGPLTGNATGLTGDPSIQVTNATVLGNLDVQGTTSTIDTAITQVDSLAVEGSVGIGTTNPAYQLSLNGTGDIRTEIVCTDNNTAGVYFRTMDGGSMVSNSTIRTDNTGNLQFFSGTSTAPERLRITSAGQLNLAGNMQFTAATPELELNNGGPRFRVPAANTLTIHTGGGLGATSNEKLRITSAGTLQIGSSATINVQITPNTGLVINDGAIDCYQATSNSAAIPFKIQSDVGGTKVVKASITAGGVISDSKGDVRDIPQSSNSSARTLVATDGGKVVMTTSGGWVIPASVMSQGNTVTLLNGDGATQTINATALNAFYNTSDGANIKANTITLGGASMATIWFSSGTVAYISATNMTVS